MNRLMTTRQPRCLAVATGLTAALWGAAGVLAGGVTAGQPATAEQALVRVCSAALLAALVWGWLQAMAGVADAWRGAAPAGRSAVRRLAVVACGAALVSALAAPAHAGVDRPGPHVLSGLPVPDRAEGPAHPRSRAVVVRPGDSLWLIARRQLPAQAGDRRIADRWHALYRRNREVVGADPDLIRPGQVLVLTEEKR
jgi:hypothetical protein